MYNARTSTKFAVSDVTSENVCYIPFTDVHFLRWAYPCKFPGKQEFFRVKGYFGDRKKGAQTIPVECRDFDSARFNVSVKWINGTEKIRGGKCCTLTRQDIQEHYGDAWPAPSRVIDTSGSSRGNILASSTSSVSVSLVAAPTPTSSLKRKGRPSSTTATPVTPCVRVVINDDDSDDGASDIEMDYEEAVNETPLEPVGTGPDEMFDNERLDFKFHIGSGPRKEPMAFKSHQRGLREH